MSKAVKKHYNSLEEFQNELSNISLKNSALILDAIRKKTTEDKELGFNWKVEDFLILMYHLTPQSYGPRIQAKFTQDLNWNKRSASENLGDAYSPLLNKNYEFKISFITSSNPFLNLVQIRLWQNVDYFCFWYNIHTGEYSVYILTHEQMEQEVELLSASAAHGTKEANKINKNVELRLPLKIDKEDADFKRWELNYKSNILDFLFVIKTEAV